jgi:hypothetical protein
MLFDGMLLQLVLHQPSSHPAQAAPIHLYLLSAQALLFDAANPAPHRKSHTKPSGLLSFPTEQLLLATPMGSLFTVHVFCVQVSGVATGTSPAHVAVTAPLAGYPTRLYPSAHA